jgi:hypothetical protein
VNRGLSARELARHAGEIADESERWFLTGARAALRGATRAKDGARRGRQKLYRLLFQRKRPGAAERLRQVIQQEAARAEFSGSEAELARFAEQIAQVVELVLSGAIPPTDVAFEPSEPEGTQ